MGPIIPLTLLASLADLVASSVLDDSCDGECNALLQTERISSRKVQTRSTSFPGYSEMYFHGQLLDHTLSDGTTWSHRYLLNKDYWGKHGSLPNGCPGPILFYTGNEAPITAFWPGNGFFIEELAPAWGALIVFAEQRYFGQSMPCGNKSTEPPCLKYLTTEQAVADYSELLGHLRADLNGASKCPAIAFGGSYGGTLAALLRAKYPGAVAGALASSSELGYYDAPSWPAHGVSEYTFADIISRGFDSLPSGSHMCMKAIRKAQQAIEKADMDDLASKFHVCSINNLGPPERRSALFTYALEELPQVNYPPDWPVSRVCENLIEAAKSGGGTQAMIAAAAAVVNMSLGPFTDCIPSQGQTMLTTPGDGPNEPPSAWGYQSCHYTLHKFSSSMHRFGHLRDYEFDLKNITAFCKKAWFGTVPNLVGLSDRFPTGYSLAEGTAGSTRIIFSVGTLDPWGGWFRHMEEPPAEKEIYHIYIVDGAHHLDLRSPIPEDPPSAHKARQKERAILWRWIEDDSRVS